MSEVTIARDSHIILGLKTVEILIKTFQVLD